jgi:hypothetical protein
MEKQDAQGVLDLLKYKAKPYRDWEAFSMLPGIYAIYLMGSGSLPFGETVMEGNCLLYIGKTESSQLKRVVNQHFGECKTGNSTLRRSLGALLRTQHNLIPQARSGTETSERRFTNYRFDDAGEEILTEWMVQNLELSFFELDENVVDLEKRLIALSVPPLNLTHNPGNPHKKMLEAARQECRRLAREKSA